METLLQRFFKHALECEQCSNHPRNPCAIGGLILSAAASVFIISTQQSVRQPPPVNPARPPHWTDGRD